MQRGGCRRVIAMRMRDKNMMDGLARQRTRPQRLLAGGQRQPFCTAAVILAMTARWWIILRADNPGIPFWPLIRYRLAVFGLSYFTPGPQVGGEPLSEF